MADEDALEGSAGRPTMADVAAAAGVSLKSVSRVVNDEPNVSAGLRARVVDAIAALDYVPDRRAAHLAAARRGGALVGYVQVDAANPFFGAVSRGVEDLVRRHGLAVVSGSTDGDPQREASLLTALAGEHVAGVVVAAAEGDDDRLRREVSRGTTLVCVDRVVPDLAADVVVSDNHQPVVDAVAHLAATGHRRIAYLGGNPLIWTAATRRQAYLDGLGAVGLEADPRLVMMGVDTSSRSSAATRSLLSNPDPPTALITGQDRITIGAISQLHLDGRQHDVAIIGFDDVVLAAQLSPALAVIAQNPYEMGRRAALLLLDRLAGWTGQPRRVVVDTPLHLRDSANVGAGPA